MLIKEILIEGKTAVSYEFFPPKNPLGWEKLYQTITDLNHLNPAYISVTYGAGGATREHTHKLVTQLVRETDAEIVAHLTCVGHSRDEMKSILDRYAESGVHNILALKGDTPSDRIVGRSKPPGAFPHASDLVFFIKDNYPGMGIGVSGFPEGHPSSVNRLEELVFLKEKVDAGADYIVTQLFFDNRDYYDFVDRCIIAGITVPVIAGIMPVTGLSNMNHMAKLAPRTRFPSGLIRAVNRAETDEGVEMAGTHWATEQMRDLLDRGAPGIHLYTLNNSASTIRMGESLGLVGFHNLR
ncbi:MAG: methylenetetrahydrofolate reductase [NAD(P)H] [Spirochaetes bacterium]|nr:MAG: methylenetetrahydrofolate reductase [NAD(P)H] [Spirochaetota bacterium]